MADEPSTKKRRKNKTLKDFFPRLLKNDKSKSTNNDNDTNNLLSLPEDVLHRRIFSMLTVQDLSNLAATCHTATKVVDVYRGPLPYIVKEEMMPVRIMYIHFRQHSPFVRNHYYRRYDDDDDDHEYDASRVRTIRFLLKTRSHRIVQITFNIGILLWTEGWNYHHSHVFPFDIIPQKTWIETAIVRQVKCPNGGGMQWKFLYESMVDYVQHCMATGYSLEQDEVLPWMESYSSRRPFRLTYDIPISVYDTEQACVDYFWLCAKRIAATSPQKYEGLPSLDYMIQRGLPRGLIIYLPRPYLVEKYCTPELNFKPPPEAAPPSNVALWKFRQAPSRQARNRFFQQKQPKRDAHGQAIRAYEIHEIPWYREWYPKPVVLNPMHLLESLPAKLVRTSILPFLTPSETLGLLPTEYIQRLQLDAKTDNERNVAARKKKELVVDLTLLDDDDTTTTIPYHRGAQWSLLDRWLLRH